MARGLDQMNDRDKEIEAARSPIWSLIGGRSDVTTLALIPYSGSG